MLHYHFVKKFNLIVKDLNEQLVFLRAIINHLVNLNPNDQMDLYAVYSEQNQFLFGRYALFQEINNAFPVEIQLTEEQVYYKKICMQVIEQKWQRAYDIMSQLMSFALGVFAKDEATIHYLINAIAVDTETVPDMYENIPLAEEMEALNSQGAREEKGDEYNVGSRTNIMFFQTEESNTPQAFDYYTSHDSMDFSM